MPIQLFFDQKPMLVVFTGELTSTDLISGARDVAAFEKEQAIVPPRLMDLRPLTQLSINFNDVMNLATDRKSLRFSNSFKSAILVGNTVQMGYARMFQSLNDHPQISIRIFTDEAEARTWLTA
jgi:hypothetical protein